MYPAGELAVLRQLLLSNYSDICLYNFPSIYMYFHIFYLKHAYTFMRMPYILFLLINSMYLYVFSDILYILSTYICPFSAPWSGWVIGVFGMYVSFYTLPHDCGRVLLFHIGRLCVCPF